MLKNNKTYEIMTPESVGVSESNLVMGKHSGRHAFKQKIIELGYSINDNVIEEAFENFKNFNIFFIIIYWKKYYLISNKEV